MQNVLYFPHIKVPESGWLVRTLLYWDQVGTIVPRDYRDDPVRLGDHTLGLVRSGLVQQVFPEDADARMARNFERFLRQIKADEIDRRRALFRRGRTERVHRDKFNRHALFAAQAMGLASAGRGEWIEVESATAVEFMAALALALCHPHSDLVRAAADQGQDVTWVPVTDRADALRSLMAGLRPAREGGPYGRSFDLRVKGEVQASGVRSVLLEQLLPVPGGRAPVDKIVSFRDKHGDLLPRMRRHIETRIDEALATEDEALRERLVERLVEEAREKADEAKAYLREAGMRRIKRSSLLRVLKFVPGLAAPIGNVQDVAESMLTNPGLESEPLAYLAFARARFEPATRYRLDPWTGTPLAEAMTGADR